MVIKRDRYLNKLKDKQWNGRIKIITGLRRTGKSFLLFELFKNYLLESGVPPDKIISITLDDDINAKYRDPYVLSEYVRGIVSGSTEKFYLLLDEIQFAISDDEFKGAASPVRLYSVLNGFLHMKNVDVYVTGSNSKMLSKDISTEFRGRGDTISVYPLSFREFLDACGLSRENAFREFALFGGLPYVLQLNTDEEKYKYLHELFDKVFFKDIIERYDIKMPEILSEITSDLCSSVGSLTNANKIAKTLTSVKGKQVSEETVAAYISYLADSFLFRNAQRYDIKGKKYFEYPSKYYCVDVGLRNVRLGLRQQEETHIMENIIFNELIYRGFAVDVGVIPLLDKDTDGKYHSRNCEIDFIASRGSEKYYIQSAFQIPSPEKDYQEIRPLLAVKDCFRKIIVTNSFLKPWTDEYGIRRIGLVDFLLDDFE